MTDPTRPADEKTISGRAVVIGLFVFAVLMTVVLSWYWNRHLGPFMPLQTALAAEFENSSPRVDGGQRKIHKETPMVLRIVMRVDFDPTIDTPDGQQRIDDRIQAIANVARDHVDLADYDQLHVHFYQPNPEQKMRQQKFERDMNDFRNASSAD